MSAPKYSPEPWEAYGNVIQQPVRAVFHGGATTLGEDNANAARAAACVNFLAGVPAEALTPDGSDERMLALAVLRGDESAAYALADELIERRKQPEGFVGRAELIGVLRAVRKASEWGGPPSALGLALCEVENVLDRLGVAPAEATSRE